MERTVKDSWKIELEKKMKKIAEELRKAELDTHQEEEKTNKEYYDVLYAPYIAGFSESLQKELKPLKVGWLIILVQHYSHENIN